MKSVYEGFAPLTTVASLAASGTHECGLINCRGLKAVTITARATYNASATVAVTANVYYSPDGKNYDTVAFDSKELTVSAGNTIQASKRILTPDTGWLKIILSNGDTSYAATNLRAWASVIYQFQTEKQTEAST